MNYEAQHLSPLTLGETNLIQIHLIQKSGQDPASWIEENSAEVRNILDQKPELAALYRRNPQQVEDYLVIELDQRRSVH